MDAQPDWPTLYTTVAAVLPAWDAWRPADDRAMAALAAAAGYAATGAPVARAALVQALVALHLAWREALQEETAGQLAGQPPGAVAGAQDAAFAVLSLGHSLLTPTAADRAAHRRNAASHAALAARWVGGS